MTTLETPPAKLNEKASSPQLSAASAIAALDEAPLAPAPKPPQSILREITEDGICVLTFDRPNSSANVFDAITLRELDAHLFAIRNNASVRGVIFTSAKKSIFIAGADLHALSSATNANQLCDIIELGQHVFNAIAALPVPTIAAINGACLGGGYELALACTYRILADDRKAVVGLPEVNFGLLPGSGGTQRLTEAFHQI